MSEKTLPTREQVLKYSTKAAFFVNKHDLEEERARVALVLDISRSMNALYKDGTVQRIIERILGLAILLDEERKIDVRLFGTDTYRLPSVGLDEIEGYVERVILPDYKINEATKYGPALTALADDHNRGVSPLPTFVIFVTDGGNSDRAAAKAALIAMSREPIFVQFVGIGKEEFPFLEKLDELAGRAVDNAGYIHVNDIAEVKDGELYDRVLTELPSWLSEARSLGIV